ncbi:MAG: hypothetical protein LBT80_07315 [Lactobacillaceae bacterium]|nr:hypothetical protein [Lactobacillaceae bacterium]
MSNIEILTPSKIQPKNNVLLTKISQALLKGIITTTTAISIFNLSNTLNLPDVSANSQPRIITVTKPTQTTPTNKMWSHVTLVGPYTENTTTQYIKVIGAFNEGDLIQLTISHATYNGLVTKAAKNGIIISVNLAEVPAQMFITSNMQTYRGISL